MLIRIPPNSILTIPRFLYELKEDCTSRSPGNKDFWKAFSQDSTNRMSLIADSEAKQYGGSSDVTDDQADMVCGLVSGGTLESRLTACSSSLTEVPHLLKDVVFGIH